MTKQQAITVLEDLVARYPNTILALLSRRILEDGGLPVTPIQGMLSLELAQDAGLRSGRRWGIVACASRLAAWDARTGTKKAR